jgi:hypothetical protein
VALVLPCVPFHQVFPNVLGGNIAIAGNILVTAILKHPIGKSGPTSLMEVRPHKPHG